MKAAPITVSVGGGKGGVGKSIVSVNLACALASIGLRTVLVDGDLGAPNLHTLLGVAQTGPTLHALLERRIERIEAALLATSVPRLSLVPGACGLPGQANPSHQEKLKLLRHITSLDADVVVIDVGAGTAYNTLDLFGAGEIRLVVATPELTSLQNAYVFTKAVALREIATLAKSEGRLEAWVTALDRGETSRASGWLERLDVGDPTLATLVREYLGGLGTSLVGNRVGSPTERHALFALSRMVREFLGMELPVAMTLPSTESITESVRRRRPAVLAGEPTLTRAFAQLAETVVTAPRRRRVARPVAGAPLGAELGDVPGFEAELGSRRRREARTTVQLPCVIVRGERRDVGVVVDLSPGGACVSAEIGTRVGETLELRVALEGHEASLAGTVRHTSSGTFGLALEPDCAARVQRLLLPGLRSLGAPT